jgi:hypothetical protein
LRKYQGVMSRSLHEEHPHKRRQSAAPRMENVVLAWFAHVCPATITFAGALTQFFVTELGAFPQVFCYLSDG